MLIRALEREAPASIRMDRRWEYVTQGQFQSTMFDIGKGCIGIYANYGEADEKQLATFGPEQVFGEMGMIESLPRSATAVALEDETVVYEIDEEEFSSYFRDKPAKVFLIMK